MTEIRTPGAWRCHCRTAVNIIYLLLENSYIVAVIYDFRKHVHISLFDATSREMPQTAGSTLYGGSLLWMAMAMITVSSTLVFYNSR